MPFSCNIIRVKTFYINIIFHIFTGKITDQKKITRHRGKRDKNVLSMYKTV